MNYTWHAKITRAALGQVFGKRALSRILWSNWLVDDLVSNMSRPEAHCTENQLPAAMELLERRRRAVVDGLRAQRPEIAWAEFGRLLHTAQDFYSHTNYVRLWHARYPDKRVGAIEIGSDEILSDPAFRTCRAYRPIGSLGSIPLLGWIVTPVLPEDAHARMNLDSSARGPLFAFAFEAAKRRTVMEFDQTVELLNVECPSGVEGFLGR